MTEREEAIARAVFLIARNPDLSGTSCDDVVAMLPTITEAIDRHLMLRSADKALTANGPVH